MNDFIGELTLDLDCRKTMPKICAGQYDKGRKYLIHITANGNSFATSDCTVMIQGIRKDKSRFSAPCSLNDTGEVILILTEDILAVSGFAYAKLILSDVAKNYSTQIFMIDVDGSYEGDITVEDNYSIVNDFMNKLMLLFNLDNPNDMLNSYPCIKGIKNDEIDTADEYSVIYRYTRTGLGFTGIVFFVGYSNYSASSAAKVVQYRLSRMNGIEYRIGTALGNHQYTWDTAWDEDWLPIGSGSGIIIIDAETSANWDGDCIPTSFEGAKGDVAFYHGKLWLLYQITERAGCTYYLWESLVDDADLEEALQYKEDTSNKTNGITADNMSSSEQYPSVKAVADYVDGAVPTKISDLANDLTNQAGYTKLFISVGTTYGSGQTVQGSLYDPEFRTGDFIYSCQDRAFYFCESCGGALNQFGEMRYSYRIVLFTLKTSMMNNDAGYMTSENTYSKAEIDTMVGDIESLLSNV